MIRPSSKMLTGRAGYAAGAFAILANFAVAQGSDAPTRFEVVSVKPSQGGRNLVVFGGPGTRDQSIFTCENLDLGSLVLMAYDLPRYRLSVPAWVWTTRFDIRAKLAEGTTKEEFRRMQQNLLIERFGVTSHTEKREHAQSYALVIAKNGPKITKAFDALASEDGRERPWVGPYAKDKDKDGFPVIPPEDHRRMLTAVDGPRIVQRFDRVTMQRLASYLANSVARPVEDDTGLEGMYDFTLKWVRDWGIRSDGSGDEGPDLFQALEAQAGLKLVAKKAIVDVLVIDRIQKNPGDN